MEKKNFDDDFLETGGDEKVRPVKNIDIEGLRLKSDGFCESFFYHMSKCKGKLTTLSQVELCDKLRGNLLQCLKNAGKYYE
jgi:hypothetical protein